jgi:elongation factor Ts
VLDAGGVFTTRIETTRTRGPRGAHQRREPLHDRRETEHTMATTAITAKEVQELRQRTGAGMMDAKKALEETAGNMDQAAEWLRLKGAAKADKRATKVAREGVVSSYIHHNGKVGVLVEVNCETDFVARNPEFQLLVKHIAEHIAAANPVGVDKDSVPADRVDRERRIFEQQVRESGKPEHLIDKIVSGKIESFYKDVALMHQEWVREPKKTIADLVKELSAKVGEKIVVRRFARFQVGEE